MCNVTLILLLQFVAQINAKEAGASHITVDTWVDTSPHLRQDSMGTIVGILVNELFNKVFMSRPLHHNAMYDRTFGKPGNIHLLQVSQNHGFLTVGSPVLKTSQPHGLLGPPRASRSLLVPPSASLQQPHFSSFNRVAKTGGGGGFTPQPSRQVTVHTSTFVEEAPEQTAQTFNTVSNYHVLRASDESEVSLSSLLAKDKQTIFAFLTHFGDFNCWELAQRLIFAKPEFADAGADIRMIGIGSVASARKFASMLDIDAASIYADPTASVYKALGYSRGFMPESNLNGYIKLLPMLLGISSPGTIQAVLSGYRGDPTARRDWVSSSLRQGSSQGRFPSFLNEGSEGMRLWSVLGSEGLRPFELATLRLQNMVGVLGKWEELAPKDDQLIVQQGGTMVVRPDGSTAFTFADRGILTYANVDELLAQVKFLK